MENLNQNQEARPPIVVVLGHVDHGKTSLLDAIRKTNITAKEVGGITQAIGASVVEYNQNKICFIDTPGHAAFTKMRGRGAKVADIAILVVAQDDGVQPQTREAIQIINDAKIPFLVAGTKADVLGAGPERLQGELEKEEIYFEGRGGQIPFVSVSSKIGTGISDLLDTIVLMSEVAEIKGDKNGELEGVVIESAKDKIGPQATVVIRNGSVKIGQTFFADTLECKVRAIFDDKGKNIKEVTPGLPAKIFGFTQTPQVGALVSSSPHEGIITDSKSGSERSFAIDINKLRRLRDDEIPLILKADNAGALEAIIASLPQKVVVVGSGVGDVNSSDIINAKTGNALVFSFESKISNEIAKLAEAEGVKTERFEIIYELLQKLEEILKGGKVQILGTAQILASFPFNNKKVAGCKVLNGKISKGDSILLIRNEKEIGKAKITSVRKQKSEVTSVGQSEEFGAIIEPQLNFEVGDALASVK